MTTAALTRTNAVATIELHSDNGLNALDDDTIDELHLLLDEVSDGQARALVLRGAGAHFSAGGDLRHLAELTEQAQTEAGRQQLTERTRRNSSLVERLRSLPLATIAAIDGACVGAAIGITAACDLRIATSRSVFSTAFLQLGLVSDFGGAALLADAIGPSRATQWMLSPGRRSGQDALEAGLVSEIVAPEDLQAHSMELAEELARFPGTVAFLKKSIATGSRSLSDRLDEEAQAFAAVLSEPSVRETVLAAVPRH